MYDHMVAACFLQAIFKCDRCGKCCTEPDCISVFKTDIDRLSKCFCVSDRDIKKHYTKNDTLKDVHPCMFYKDGCEIYAHRPNICRLFPFATITMARLGRLDFIEWCPASHKLFKNKDKIHIIYNNEILNLLDDFGRTMVMKRDPDKLQQILCEMVKECKSLIATTGWKMDQ